MEICTRCERRYPQFKVKPLCAYCLCEDSGLYLKRFVKDDGRVVVEFTTKKDA
jgi:hypothetical protein